MFTTEVLCHSTKKINKEIIKYKSCGNPTPSITLLLSTSPEISPIPSILQQNGSKEVAEGPPKFYLYGWIANEIVKSKRLKGVFLVQKKEPVKALCVGGDQG